MIRHNLRKGDLLVSNFGRVGILTKKTKKYWYYFSEGSEARISEKRLWSHIDRRVQPLQVKFGSSMKRRREQKKNRTLDLHGVRMKDVEEKVKSFLNWAELPVSIVTGNSTAMKDEVKKIVDEYEWSCHESPYNNGEIIVREQS